MKALTFHKEQGLELRDVPEPVVSRDDEVRIEVKASGICGTDLHILGGAYPAKPGVVLGHESTGVVLEVGKDVKRFKAGDQVILDPTYHCGVCYYCQRNRPNYCQEKATTETGVSANGTFTRLHVARESFLHPLPEQLTFEEGTLTEPLACALHAIRQTRLRPEYRTLVVGAGPMGLLFALATTAMGSETFIGDVQPYRIEFARTVMDRVHNLNGDGLAMVNGGKRFDLIIDTSGCMLEKLLPRVDKGGEILLAGLNYSYEAKIHPSYLTDNGISIVGSIDTNRTFAPAIDLLCRVKAFGRIISHRFPLDQYDKAFGLLGFDLASRKRSDIHGTKVVLMP
jgi:2-desacetyl-2-hydroxyethyl bacteriochlorophyllide A dehydrogenase